MKIAILDDYANAARTLKAYAKLAGHEVTTFTDHVRDPDALAARLKGFEALVVIQQRLWMPRAVIEKLPASVKLISQTGHWYAHIDAAACTERGIAITAAGTTNYDAPAQLAWALILASMRHIPQEAASIRAGGWLSTLGTEVNGRTLGIYAYGNIGSIVAGVGRAFGMRVMCWGRGASMEKARAAGYDVAASREAFFGESDIISLHMPLRPDSRGVVTPADLARMKQTALLVNVSRGALVGDQALADALKKGRPGRAAVDVYEDEPVSADHPLTKLDNCLCTPHLGYNALDTFERYLGGAFDHVVAFASGKPINVVNPAVLQK
ncbi:MAG: D-2-hydroxyacid dehydrogenase family protein [Burkholderiales bacterium]